MTREQFKALFDLYFAQVRRYVLFRSGNTEVATDIAQETFMKIWEKHQHSDAEKLKGLLFKIANDLFISHYRKEKRSFEFFEHYQMVENNHSPEDRMAFEQLKKKYENALKRMPEKQRTVFLMSRVDDLKYTEISTMAGISVKAVEKRMKHALDFLRKNLIND